ncbi:hypothetical protein AAF712_015108 [Marasmius tenuissimus]|uniref:Uncharacterized protein n=1 Tax=Marasmius tenuissimus TaxID=585030 RepID=A0ABR2ZA51_9AGAR
MVSFLTEEDCQSFNCTATEVLDVIFAKESTPQALVTTMSIDEQVLSATLGLNRIYGGAVIYLDVCKGINPGVYCDVCVCLLFVIGKLGLTASVSSTKGLITMDEAEPSSQEAYTFSSLFNALASHILNTENPPHAIYHYNPQLFPDNTEHTRAFIVQGIQPKISKHDIHGLAIAQESVFCLG